MDLPLERLAYDARRKRPYLGRLRHFLQSADRRQRALEEAVRGKTVLITGASFGIGQAAALRIGAAGARTLLVARTSDALEATRDQIKASGGTPYLYLADLSDLDQCDALIDQVIADHGGVDVLINNAGVSVRRPITDSWHRWDEFDETMRINYFGAVRLILGLAPGMCERRRGHIINVSTLGTQCGPPYFSAYVAAKSALDEFSRCVGVELEGKGIDFTTIHMGLVRTRMIKPTVVYDGFPALSILKAAELICMALVHRPLRVSTRTGIFVTVVHAVWPRLERWLFRTFHDRVHWYMYRWNQRRAAKKSAPQ
jgi:NAD(P)-dependent dehydrogenase (short-subunit alcohol dehydrogenase family)